MTTRDNIIFRAITVGLIFIVGGCLLSSHISKQTGHSGEINEEKQLMAEVLATYAAIISAISALMSTGVVIWTTCFRKTERDRIDELKRTIQVMLSQGWEERIINRESTDDFFNSLKSLKPKFQKPKYEMFHQSAFDELGYEGKNGAYLFLHELQRKKARERAGLS